MTRRLPLLAALVFAACGLNPTLHAQPLVTIKTVTMRDPGGLADKVAAIWRRITGRGSVPDDFEIGKYEVTWDEWRGVRSWAVSNGYSDLDGVGAGRAGNHPVQSVNWYDVVKWSNAKSEREGLTPVYRVDGGRFIGRGRVSLPSMTVRTGIVCRRRRNGSWRPEEGQGVGVTPTAGAMISVPWRGMGGTTPATAPRWWAPKRLTNSASTT